MVIPEVIQNYMINFLRKYLLLKVLVIALSTGIFYSLGYLFLYGFYFGNNNDEPLPAFREALLSAIPFNHISVIIIGSLFFLMLVFIACLLVILFKPLKQKKQKSGVYYFLTIISFLIINLFISMFFVGKFSASVLVLWIAPIVVVFGVFSYNKYSDKPWVLLGASVNVTFFLILVTLVINNDSLDSIIIGLGIIILFPMYLLVFGKAEISEALNATIAVNPGFAILFGIIFEYVSKIDIGWVGLIISYIFTFPVYYFFYLKVEKFKKSREKDPQTDESKQQEPTMVLLFNLFKEANFNFKVIFLVASILLFAVGVVRLSLGTGKYIRNFIPPRHQELIKVPNEKQIIGHVVAHQDGLFYISSNWRLATVKADSIIIEIYRP